MNFDFVFLLDEIKKCKKYTLKSHSVWLFQGKDEGKKTYQGIRYKIQRDESMYLTNSDLMKEIKTGILGKS